jgi:type I restriction enzyme S subunit
MQTVITQYKDLTRWDIKNYLWLFRSSFSVEPLGSYIYEHSEKEKIGDQVDKEFPILGVTNKIGVYLNEYVKSQKINQPYKKVKGGELTYNPYRVNVGSIGIVHDEYDNFFISPAYVIFGTKEGLLNEYIYLVLSSDWFNPYLRAATSGSVRQNLTFDLLSQLKVPVPHLKIQEKIVSDWRKAEKETQELNKKAEEKEKAIDDYILCELGIEKKEYGKKKGAFVVCFKDLEEWGITKALMNKNLSFIKKIPLVKMSDVCVDFKNGVNFSAGQVGQGVKFVNIKDVYSEKYVNNENLERVKLSEKEIKNNQLKNNDLVFVRSSVKYEGVAYPSLIKTDKEPIVFCGFLIKCSPLANLIDPNYLLHLLKTSMYRNLLIALSVKTLITNISQDKIKDLKIPLPPLPKQKEIAEKVEKMRAEIQEIKNTADETLEQAKNKIGEMLKV